MLTPPCTIQVVRTGAVANDCLAQFLQDCSKFVLGDARHQRRHAAVQAFFPLIAAGDDPILDKPTNKTLITSDSLYRSVEKRLYSFIPPLFGFLVRQFKNVPAFDASLVGDKLASFRLAVRTAQQPIRPFVPSDDEGDPANVLFQKLAGEPQILRAVGIDFPQSLNTLSWRFWLRLRRFNQSGGHLFASGALRVTA